MRKSFLSMLAAVAFAAAAAAQAGAAEKGVAAAKKTIGDAAVQVAYYLQYDDGDAPGAQDRDYGRSSFSRDYAGAAVSDQRELEASGFLVDKDLVLANDLLIEPRFIKRIEVRVAGKTYAAQPERFATGGNGVFLKLAEPATGAKPLVFKKSAAGPYFSAGFYDDQGRQSMFVSRIAENEYMDADGKKFMRAQSPTLVVTADGTIVGASFGERLMQEGDWKGSPLDWPVLSAAQYAERIEAVKKAAAAGLLHVTINMRIEQSRRATRDYDQENEGPAEIEAVGLVYAPNKVLVLESMTRKSTARIESMTLALGDKTVPLKVEGALSRYGAILASFEGSLPGAAPIAFDDSGASATNGALLVGDELSYGKGARDERFSRSRWSGKAIGFLGLTWPRSAPDESRFLFTLDGKLAALPLGKRALIEMAHGYRDSSDRGGVLMPAGRLSEMLAKGGDNVDADYKPLSATDAKRFVWLGIETQEIAHELAKAKGAALETKGGEVGGLISYVYKDSPADRAGVKSGDILVRVFVPGQMKPVDYHVAQDREFEFPWSRLDEVPDIYFDRIPRPWPSQDNELAQILTEVGAGRTVTALFVSGGKEKTVDFKLELAPPDFATADSYENKAAGLTVKNATYEVRHYFQMKDDDPGVVAAEIAPGSKTSVAGVKPCEIITAVNGVPVHNVADFKKGLEKGGDVELTVKRMSQTRVAKMTLPTAETQAKTPAVESTGFAAAPTPEPASADVESTTQAAQ